MNAIKCEIPKKCVMRDSNGVCKLNIICLPIVDKCVECGKIENDYCRIYPSPRAKWSAGRVCPSATHVKEDIPKIESKRRFGQQKQKKKK